MKLQLKADLEKAIRKWSAESCSDEAWPNVYMGNVVERLMVDAAANVFDAVVENQEYVVREGYLSECQT